MLVYEAEVAGPPKTLSLYNGDGGFTGREVIYGTSDGKIGLIELTHDEPIPKWELANEKRLPGVTCIDSFDITCDGVLDLIVSREDGLIEVSYF
jgi:Bardet-Biedl syndrome 7 protein